MLGVRSLRPLRRPRLSLEGRPTNSLAGLRYKSTVTRCTSVLVRKITPLNIVGNGECVQIKNATVSRSKQRGNTANKNVWNAMFLFS